MKTFEELRTILEVNFKADHKKFHIATAKIKNTEIHYHQEKKGSKKVRVFVKPKSSKEHEELGVFRDMNQARKSAEQFVKLMGEDIDEGVSFLKKIVKKAKPDGEVIREAVLQGKDYVFDKKKKKVVISKDNYKKVQRDSKTTIKGVPYIMYNMGNQGTVLAPVHFEEAEVNEALSFGFDTMRGANQFKRKFPDSEPVQIVRVHDKKKHIVNLRDTSKGDVEKAAKFAAQISLSEENSLEEKKKDMTAISSWKKKLQKVKGLTKQQIQMLNTLPTPVITSLINQIGMVVASNDMAEDGHTDVISAKNQVKIAMKALNTMNQELNKLNDEDELPSWWTNKVAVAVNKLDGMADYLDIKVENVTDIFKESDVKGLQEKAEKALKNKAKETGMPLGILRKVFQRGVKAWQSGHRPGTNAVQWGLARVNSFVTKGKGTWGKADSDLAAKVRKSEEIEEKAPDTDDAMKRFKAGKAGFTDKAHLKAKGLIPRADGTKRKSDKYK